MGCPAGQLCDVANNVCVGDYVTFSASEADDYCANLSYAGYDDWLLPNIDHFRMLIDGCPGTEHGNEACGITHDCHEQPYGYCPDLECEQCTYLEGPGAEGIYLPTDYLGDGDGNLFAGGFGRRL